ncbi:hypothetical protein V8F06_000195 [Rhypophila decipiens]
MQEWIRIRKMPFRRQEHAAGTRALFPQKKSRRGPSKAISRREPAHPHNKKPTSRRATSLGSGGSNSGHDGRHWAWHPITSCWSLEMRCEKNLNSKRMRGPNHEKGMESSVSVGSRTDKRMSIYRRRLEKRTGASLNGRGIGTYLVPHCGSILLRVQWSSLSHRRRLKFQSFKPVAPPRPVRTYTRNGRRAGSGVFEEESMSDICRSAAATATC